ncbi:SMC-Scp complex subunit ScpB [Aceticella autotrophica]|uniref:SMC-Scp complex subunit ScpB n=1 Tax=Aceticella autotrophica TaxID=2755338 RepID=A0A974Y2N0_9THEO|nr:SMC-Scp complex subunit ScpB [Aceticella autotrophica]QSZ26479.1 SMC-Scp complex subunit ScpB [Aceticella autotrophica]
MHIENILEAILFASGGPVKIKTLSNILNLPEKEVIEAASNLEKYYEKERRGIKIIKINSSFEMCSNEIYGEYVKKALDMDVKQGLSQAALEVLSIIAYNQPITRMEIEKIRGVKCEKAINTLLQFNLIKDNGRVQGPGRAILYVTTEDFLKCFNLPSLNQLPPIDNIN